MQHTSKNLGKVEPVNGFGLSKKVNQRKENFKSSSQDFTLGNPVVYPFFLVINIVKLAKGMLFKKKFLFIAFLLFPLGKHLQAQTITTIAGTGTAGYSGDGGPATSAQVDSPHGLATDGSGNLFIADILNHRIRKVDASGTITTVAGTGTVGFSGDGGPATDAQFRRPMDVAVDELGNLFIADILNHRIRKVDASGTITTVAGTGTAGYSGDGGPATNAQFDRPYSLDMDGSGNLFIADILNHRIRKVDASGTITTVAGTGTAGYSGDGGPATDAQLNVPAGVVVDWIGNLFIADSDNHRIRKTSITYDVTAPSVVTSSLISSPTNRNPIPVAISFSEAVTGFIASDVVVGNATLENLQSSDSQTFTAELIPSADGIITVDIAANAANDAAGNGNTAASQFSITYESTEKSLWAWGYNYYNQLGDGTSTDKHTPLKIGTATDWASVAAGANHTLALKTDGTLWAWGSNSNGQLGDGTTMNRLLPVQVGNDTDWASVVAGIAHTLAIKTDGSLWAWGNNSSGQLGDGTSTDRHTPLKIGTATDWTSVVAGYYHTLALKTDGTLWAWGANHYGQLGDGTTTIRYIPVQVGSPANLKKVVAGGSHTLALADEVNVAPVLATIGNKAVDELTELSFTATATYEDEPANTLSYSLEGAPTGASITTAGVFSWTPTEEQGPASYTFIVKVYDGSLSDEEEITVTVNEVNIAPVLALIGDASTTCGGTISFTAIATDEDLPANTLTYSIEGSIPSGATLNSTTGAFSWSPTAEQLGSHQFTIRVTDNGAPALFHEKTFTLSLEDTEAPVVETQNITIQLNAEGATTITAEQINSESSDNCTAASSLLLSLDKSSFTCANLGANSVTLTVTDASGNSSAATSIVTVEDNTAPAIEAGQIFTIDENSSSASAVGTVAVTDNCSIESFSINPGNTADAFAVDAGGSVTVNNAAALDYETSPEFTLTVTAVDAAGNASSQTVLVRLNNLNDNAPVLATIPAVSGNELELISFTATASDKENDKLQFSLAGNVPEGASISATTGVFNWTPAEVQGPASYTFNVSVTDGELSDSKEVTITVNEVNQAPVFTSEAVTSAREGNAYSYQVTATDADLPASTLTYEALDIPYWLSFDATTQILSGTPDRDAEQSNLVRLQVSDGQETVIQEFTLIVEITTGLFDRAKQEHLLVYPNPTKGRLIIEMGDIAAEEKVTVSLLSLEGRLLLQKHGSLQAGTESISNYLQEAKMGTYLLQVKAKDSLRSIKVIKE
jgi:hypothetical protein